MKKYEDMTIYEIANIIHNALNENLIKFESCNISQPFIKQVIRGEMTIIVPQEKTNENNNN